MKPIEIVSNGKDKSVLRTKDRNGYPYDLYYINSKEDLFHLKEVVDNFIQETYKERANANLDVTNETTIKKDFVKQNSPRLFIERKAIETECIKSYGYNEEEKVLDLEFNSGGDYIYRYYDVPKEVSEKLLKEKFGKYFNKHFRNIYKFGRFKRNENENHTKPEQTYK